MRFDEFLEQFHSTTPPVRIELGWEVLPALDGTLHAVDPDPDKMVETYAVSLCNRALIAKEAEVSSSKLCVVCQEISRERQREFDIECGQVAS
jgi:hypothetical protein